MAAAPDTVAHAKLRATVKLHAKRTIYPPGSDVPCRGFYLPEEGEIHVATGRGNRVARMTLLHECMHLIIHARGEKMPLAQEEKVCELAELVIDLLDQNPQIRDFITNGTSRRK